MDAILSEIHALLGDKGLLSRDDAAQRPTSWADPRPCQAAAIVRPASTEELSGVMKICHRHGQAVIPLGGATGLVGAVNAENDQLLLSLERMKNIESVDTQGGTMTVEAGVLLQTVQETAAANDYLFPVDFGARGSAHIGGAISTNAGGNEVLRFGMMREQILGLEAVLADGTIISSMNSMLKNNAGYDLKQLFIGSEGTLGIVTRAVLRLRPILRSKCTAMVALDTFDNIPVLLRSLSSALGGTLTSFEVQWNSFYQLITGAHPERPLPLGNGYPYYVLLESCGADQEADQQRFNEALEQVFEAGVIVDAAVAQSSQQREEMWGIRDDIETLMHQLSPLVIFDISIPIEDGNRYIETVKAKLEQQWPGAQRMVTFGHLGDSNIHLAVTIGPETPEQEKAIEDIVYDQVNNFNGSISAEHGIGTQKISYLHHSRTTAEIALMSTLKTALDPKGILSPGRVLTQRD